MSGGTWLAVLLILSLVGAATAVGWWVWTETSDIAIGMHGYIALGLGVTATVALAVGLMTLVWRSDRHGYDDEADRD
jgi:hypothetical protein